VLVVDDNKVIRQLIRVNLELEGIEVVTAADGAECLDIVHQVRPDVITLDVVMPRLDGLRTAARLRADPRTRNVPLAIVSACTQYEVESGLDVGVDAFLAKPFEPAELVRLVRQLMERGSREGAGPELDGEWGSGVVGAPAPLGSSHGTSHASPHGSIHGSPHGSPHGTSHGTSHSSSRAAGGPERAGRAGN
jgi:CheY-like chemotaxis protein